MRLCPQGPCLTCPSSALATTSLNQTILPHKPRLCIALGLNVGNCFVQTLLALSFPYIACTGLAVVEAGLQNWGPSPWPWSLLGRGVSSPKQGNMTRAWKSLNVQSWGSPRRGWGMGDKELAGLMGQGQQEERGVFRKAGNAQNLREAGGGRGQAGSRQSLAGKMLGPLGALSRDPIPGLQRRGATRTQGG